MNCAFELGKMAGFWCHGSDVMDVFGAAGHYLILFCLLFLTAGKQKVTVVSRLHATAISTLILILFPPFTPDLAFPVADLTFTLEYQHTSRKRTPTVRSSCELNHNV